MIRMWRKVRTGHLTYLRVAGFETNVGRVRAAHGWLVANNEQYRCSGVGQPDTSSSRATFISASGDGVAAGLPNNVATHAAAEDQGRASVICDDELAGLHEGYDSDVQEHTSVRGVACVLVGVQSRGP